MYCYLEFKLRYLKKKSFGKESFEFIVLRRKEDGFLLSLEAFSWETDLSVTLGDFTVKTAPMLTMCLGKDPAFLNQLVCDDPLFESYWIPITRWPPFMKCSILIGRKIGKLGKSAFNLKIDWAQRKRGVRQIITIICVTYVQKDSWFEL